MMRETYDASYGVDPPVSQLVAHLRAVCEQARQDSNEFVCLRRDLVLAIADGIEATTRPVTVSEADTKAVMDAVAKEIVRAIVKQLFEPVMREEEKAFQVAQRLGLSKDQVAVARQPYGLGAWLAAGGLALGLPAIWSLLRATKLYEAAGGAAAVKTYDEGRARTP